MLKIIFPVALTLSLTSCSLLSTSSVEKSRQARLLDVPQKKWPIQKPVNIYWNQYMVPFVEAQTDSDAAFTLGVLHAHLRWGQIEILKRLVSGRAAEMAGPFFAPKIDKAIRTINPTREVAALYKALPPKDKEWVDGFARGINFYIDNTEELPPEFAILNMKKENWTSEDVFRVARLAGADITWALYFQFLELVDEPGWNEFWKSSLERVDLNTLSVGNNDITRLNKIYPMVSKAGSNSVAISGKRTASGSALMANDPHLGIFSPNLWVLVGIKSPTYHSVGYMIPGTPSIAVGRNPHIAWGGTNMRGISSHLFEVTPDQIISEREESIPVRWWFDTSVKIRESTKGPVVSDLSLFESDRDIALTWMGHQKSSEISAFLAANRAKNWTEFRQAFADYAVSAQNMTYADKKGNIGMVIAVRQPLLQNPQEMDLLVKSANNSVSGYKSPVELPEIYNPKTGYIASSNNKPVETTPRLAYAYSHPDRIQRFNQLFGEHKQIDMELLRKWQKDVYSISAVRIQQAIKDKVDQQKIPAKLQDYFKHFINWDGHYYEKSVGALAFETLTVQLKNDISLKNREDSVFAEMMTGGDIWRDTLYEDMEKMSPNEVQKAVHRALLESKKEFQSFANFGAKHKLVVQHPLGNLPLVGSRFRYAEHPSSGSSTTINKAAHSHAFGETPVSFGAQSRHISDLSDINANYFVMLGGNDGWLNNPHLNDQVELWRKGQYMKIPLEMNKVRTEFSKNTTRFLPLNN